LSAKFSRQIIWLTTAMTKETAGCRSHELDGGLGSRAENRAVNLDLMDGSGGDGGDGSSANDDWLRSWW